MRIDFTKYQGLGNDFILIDYRHQAQLEFTPKQAMQLCDRHFGIGGDGVIFVMPGQEGADYTMKIYNSDGSEPEMCGNGIRCMARFIAELEQRSRAATIAYAIRTQAGLIKTELLINGQVRVDMGLPKMDPKQIPTTLSGENNMVIDVPLEVERQHWNVTCVSMGNPHCITFVKDASAVNLEKWGPKFEHHPKFPQRTNAEFVEILSRDHLKMRVWERGSGVTLACGTGACASLVAAVLNQKCDRKATVDLPGGSLDVEWPSDRSVVFMTGPATRVFSGCVEIEGI